jgi:sucrose-6-phosphate hydrolase SacC (GH32 family)
LYECDVCGDGVWYVEHFARVLELAQGTRFLARTLLFSSVDSSPWISDGGIDAAGRFGGDGTGQETIMSSLF